MSKNVVVVTATKTDNPLDDYRFTLAIQTCMTSVALGYDTIVVDGSADQLARELLSKTGAIVHKQSEVGMGNSRRECIRHGLCNDASVVCWIEPEKVGMVPVLEPMINMVNSGSDIVIPWRTRLFEDYPMYQALSEARAAAEISELTGLTHDWLVGTRIMSKRAAELMSMYVGRSIVDEAVQYDDNWGIHYVPVLWAYFHEYKISSCKVNYAHPPIQTAMESKSPEMDRKRDMQRTVLLSDMRKEFELLSAHKE